MGGELDRAVQRLREQFRPGIRPPPFVRLLPRACGIGAVLIAVLLRAPTICSGLPYIDYIDEGYVLHQSIDLLNQRSLDTRWYGYPSLPAYLAAAALLAFSPIYELVHGHGFRQDLPPDRALHTSQGDNYDLISPPALIIAGRFVAMVLSVLTVALAGLLAATLGGARLGGLAMILVATCPALTSRASNVIVDTFATFFALWSLYFCARLAKEPALEASRMNWRSAFAGATAGLAFASKYTVAVVFAAVAFTIVVLPVSRIGRLRLLGLAGAGFCLSAAMFSPAVVFNPGAVFREIATTAHSYTIMKSAPGYFGQAISFHELGWPLVIAGAIGLLLLLRSETDRPVALGWLIFGAVLIGLFIPKPFQPFRNLLPLVPPFCIAAALAFDRLLKWTTGSGRAPLWHRIGTLAIAAVVMTMGFASAAQLRKRMIHRDSRIQAVDWLQKHVRPGDRVLAIAELALLPSELNRIGAPVQVVRWSDASNLLPRPEFHYLVSGSFTPRSAIPGFRPRATFGAAPTPMKPYFWRTNDERILIFSRPSD